MAPAPILNSSEEPDIHPESIPKRGDHFLQADSPGLIVPGKPGRFRLADYALRDSIPSLADRGGEV